VRGYELKKVWKTEEKGGNTVFGKGPQRHRVGGKPVAKHCEYSFTGGVSEKVSSWKKIKS